MGFEHKILRFGVRHVRTGRRRKVLESLRQQRGTSAHTPFVNPCSKKKGSHQGAGSGSR